MLFGFEPVFVDANDDVLALVYTRLTCGCGFFDQSFRHAGCNRLGHATEFVDFAYYLPSLIDQFGSQGFDVIAATQWIYDLGNPGFLGQNDLRIARDPCREFGRQRNGFIQCIGVQRLRPAQRRGHRLDRCADDVVVGILFLQRHA